MNVTTFSTTNSTGLHNSLQVGIYIINLLFSFPAHSYVIRLIITGAGSGIAAEFFVLTSSVCEIAICLKTLIFVLSVWLQSLSILDQFFVGFTTTGRPLFQCLICVERYLAVVHPVTFLKYKPLRYRLICCTAAWIFCFGSCVFCMFTLSSYQSAYLLLFIMQLTVFLSIKYFCLSAVLRALKQSGPGERGREREEENPMKRRAFHLILITTVSTIIAYGPFTIASIISIVQIPYLNIMTVWVSALICFFLAGFVQPVLYLQRTGKIPFFYSPKV
ncbi:C-C chemokine receptor type 8-like [Triplophysa dalaica]|uniref:C-C chemokine receptor type 8-like n=1 Tax=Triplophysa dalaica TaxID=1582913 RepID=UPI0024DF63BB|nr:C-C chemokine receptor type 8-like [Triplophysa dalaica]